MCHSGRSQFLMDLVDTTTEKGQGMLSILRNYDNLRISGYMQPQFQVAGQAGISSYISGDFAPNVNNRFMLRRGRVRFDYIHYTKNSGPSVEFVFQFDGTERGVVIRDFWGRVMENKLKVFALTVGMFARPFSYELNLSSSDRESPERGRMSQILTKTERDLGAMVSFEPRGKEHPLRYWKLDAGLFNGQGLAATADFDSRKDFIARLYHKPQEVAKNIYLSGGLSYLNGGLLQNTRYLYTTSKEGSVPVSTIDSSESNAGKIAPRKYAGTDLQLKIMRPRGATELRGEVVFGKQTATLNSSETPPALLQGTASYYTRNFHGAYFYLLHNIFSTRHQLGLKYDWYDPNTDVDGKEVVGGPEGFTGADVRYDTFGGGYIYYVTQNLKLTAWYDHVMNERTLLTGFTEDVKDDVFTLRMQFRF